MNVIFIKGGDYTPSMYFDTAGAANDLFQNTTFSQLIRSNAIFTLTRRNDGFAIVEGGEVREKAAPASIFSFGSLLDSLENNKLVFFGAVVGDNDVVSTHSILSRAHAFIYNENEKCFYSLATKQKLTGNSVVSLLYLFKMSNSNTYSCVLNNLVNIDAFAINGPNDGIFEEPNCRLVFSDQGNSIRSKLFNPAFSAGVISMDYGYYLPTQTICVKKGEPFSLKLFNSRYVVVDQQFLEGFKIEVNTPLEYTKTGDEISFITPSTAQTLFVSIQVRGTHIFDFITTGNSFERLALNFLVLIY